MPMKLGIRTNMKTHALLLEAADFTFRPGSTATRGAAHIVRVRRASGDERLLGRALRDDFGLLVGHFGLLSVASATSFVLCFRRHRPHHPVRGIGKAVVIYYGRCVADGEFRVEAFASAQA